MAGRIMVTYVRSVLVAGCICFFADTLVAIAQGQAVAERPAAASRNLPADVDGLAGAGPLQRAEWFDRLWQERRAKFAADAERQQGSLVFFGDSITQDWGDDFRGAFDGVKTANRGISGDTTRGMLFRLADDVIALKPAGVVMLMGTNDVELGATPQTIADNIKLILERLESHNAKMPVVLCQVMPSSSTRQRPADKIRELNRLIGEAAKGKTQVTVVDTFTLYANQQGEAKPEEFGDLLHPNPAGYGKWKAGLWPILATLGFVNTTPDVFTPEAGFESLFNGNDLTGWAFQPSTPDDLRVSAQYPTLNWPKVATETRFDGKTQTDDGRYVAKNGRLIITTPTEGRRVQKLSTTRQFGKDFELRLEFRASPNADSGVFLRDRQLQCRDYPLAGPYRNLTKYRPQDWNELVITVKGNVAHATCNGEVIEEAYEIPATGPIGFEGDRGQMEYRRIRIREERG